MTATTQYPNPKGWAEYIVITDHIPSGKNHTGDLVDIKPFCCFARYAKRPKSPGFSLPWIPSTREGPFGGHWDNVCISAPPGERLPYSDELWIELFGLIVPARFVAQRMISLVASPKEALKLLMAWSS